MVVETSWREKARMKIVVCIKQVPDVTEIQFDPESKTIIREGVKNIVNPFDRRAVTQAVELVKQRAGDVLVITMGPPQARGALIECLAMGADRAAHLCDPALAGSDTLVTAKVLAQAIRRLAPDFDLIICGKYSVDAETGQVGPELAELLDVPQVCGLTSFDLLEDEKRFRGHRETDDGLELVECALPAVVTAAERLIRPLKVKEPELEAAKGKPIQVLTAADLGLSLEEVGFAGSPTYVSAISIIENSRRVQFLSNQDLDAAAEELLAIIDRYPGKSTDGAKELLGASAPVRQSGPEVWVTIERLQGHIRSASLELLGQAARLARALDGRACAVMFGAAPEEEIIEVSESGADHIYLLTPEDLNEYSSEAWSQALSEAIERKRPLTVLCPSSADGRDYAPRVAARLGLGLTGDCIGLEVDELGRLVQLKPAYGGSIVARILTRTTPVMATVRPGIFALPQRVNGRRVEISQICIRHSLNRRTRVLERQVEAGQAGIELDRARRVIGVGAGIGTPNALPLIEQLAERLGAVIGASRKVVDLGWLPRQQQIGLTGKSIGPDVYLAVALRGNMNHTVGIRRAGLVLAINSDPEAEIFQAADYGIVADYRVFVPALLRALERRWPDRSAANRLG